MKKSIILMIFALVLVLPFLSAGYNVSTNSTWNYAGNMGINISKTGDPFIRGDMIYLVGADSDNLWTKDYGTRSTFCYNTSSGFFNNTNCIALAPVTMHSPNVFNVIYRGEERLYIYGYMNNTGSKQGGFWYNWTNKTWSGWLNSTIVGATDNTFAEGADLFTKDSNESLCAYGGSGGAGTNQIWCYNITADNTYLFVANTSLTEIPMKGNEYGFGGLIGDRFYFGLGRGINSSGGNGVNPNWSYYDIIAKSLTVLGTALSPSYSTYGGAIVDNRWIHLVGGLNEGPGQDSVPYHRVYDTNLTSWNYETPYPMKIWAESCAYSPRNASIFCFGGDLGGDPNSGQESSFIYSYRIVLSEYNPSSGSSTANYSNMENKVLYYRFNQGSGTTAIDSTGYGRNGTFSNTVVWEPSNWTGFVNGSRFTAQRYLNTTLVDNSSLIKNFTIEMRLNPLDVTSAGFLGWGNPGGNGWGLTWDGAGKLAWAIGGGCGQINSVGQTWVTGRNLHLVVTRRDNNWSLYENGTVQLSRSCAGPASFDNNLIFGYDLSGYFGGYYLGQIDQMIVWDRALNNTEVLDLYNANEDGSSVPSPADTTPPTITILYPPNGTSTNLTGLPINYTATDNVGLSTCWWNVNNTANQTITCNTNITGQTWSNGLNTVTIYANDTSGNVNFSRVSFNITTYNPFDLYDCANITSPGIYNLQSDILSMAGQVCFNITSNDVIFNGLGHKIITQNLYSQHYGIGSFFNRNITIKNLNLSNFSNYYSKSIYLVYVNNSNIFNINITAGSEGILISDSKDINISNSSMDLKDDGVLAFYSNNIYSYNISVSRAILSGIWYEDTNNSIAENINFLGSSWAIVLCAWGGCQGNKIVYSSNYGKITFTNTSTYINGKIVYPGNISIGNNSAYVKLSFGEASHQVANVSLYNLRTNFYKPRIIKDGSVCTNCYNFTDLNAGNVIFNVTSWSNYSIQSMIVPNIYLNSPLNVSYLDIYSYNRTLNMTISGNETSISSIWYSLNNGVTNITTSTFGNLQGLTAGSNKLIIWVNDSYNNINSTTTYFYLAFTPKINNINITNSSISYSRNGLDNDLVAYYTFDENNTNVKDYTGKYNGTFSGGQVTTPVGRVGSAYQFDGINDWVNLSFPQALQFNDTLSFSFVAWVYPLQLNTTTGHSTGIIGVDQRYALDFSSATSSNGNLRFGLRNSSGNISSAAFSIPLYKWSFVVGTYDATTNNISLYYDGIVRSSVKNLVVNVSNVGKTYIGIGRNNNALGGTPHYFNGTIDEVRIYNRSLSAEEVKYLYSLTNPTYQELANVTINATITDEDTTNNNLWYSWLVDGIEKLSGFAENIFNYVFNQRTTNVTLVVNDTDNYQVTQYWNITESIDTPLIQFVSPTQPNNSFFTDKNIYVNVTSSDVSLQNITLNLYNISSVLINSSNSSTSPFYYNFSNLVDGIYYYNATSTDYFNNKNSTETRKITLDSTYPLIKITYPANTSYYTTPTELNYTYTETNPYNCWYSLDGGVNNITLVCGQNVTGLTPSQGSNIWFVAINDSTNKINVSKVTFFVDSSDPIIDFVEPTEQNNTYLDRTSIYINVSVIDVGLSNITINLYNGTGSLIRTNTTLTSPNYVNYSSLTDGVYYFNATARDSLNNENHTETRKVTIDNTIPALLYGSGVANNGANLSQTYIFINTTWTEINFANITFLVSNSTGIYNSTTYNTAKYGLTFINLPNGRYYYNATLCDLAGNCNTTYLKTITLDTQDPSATLMTPANATYNSTNSMNFTANVTDNLGIKNATLNIYNSTSLVNRTTISFPGNLLQTTVGIVVTLVDNTYRWFYQIFDWAGNEYITQNNTITIDTTKPQIRIVYPTNNSKFTTSSFPVNYTLSDTNVNVSSCKWTKNMGVTNTTITCGQNVTGQTWGQGYNNITIYISGLAGNTNSSTVTFFVDTIKPQINITYPRPVNYTSVVTHLNYTINEANPGTCRYSLNNGSTNTTITCGQNVTGLTSSEGWNTWVVFINDTVGNSNLSRVTFFVDSQAPTINFTSPTPINTSVVGNVDIVINITGTEANLNDSWLEWIRNGVYNNYSMTCVKTNPYYCNYTKEITQEGTFYFRAYVRDTSGWINMTEIRTGYSDVNFPQIRITTPLATNYTAKPTILNYTYTETNPVTCQYSTNAGATNTTITCGQNVTGLNPSQGWNTWLVSITDIASNVNISAVRFFVDTLAPNATITNPSGGSGGGTVYNKSKTQNFTINLTDMVGGTDMTNSSGLKNATLVIINNQTNTIVNQTSWSFSNLWQTVVSFTTDLVDGIYNFFVVVADNLGNIFTSDSKKITIDTTNPNITINSPANYEIVFANTSNYTMVFNYTINDSNLNSCWYSLNNGANVSLASCPTGQLYINTSLANTNITLWAADLANNTYYTRHYLSLVFVNGAAYSAYIPETSRDTMSITGRKDSNVYSIVGILNYSGTDYITNAIIVGENYTLQTQVDIPVGSDINRSFNWRIVARSTYDQKNYTTQYYSQRITNLTLYPCETPIGDGLTLNMTTYDESTADVINASLETTTTYYASGGSGNVYKNITYDSINESKSNWYFCLNATNSNATVNAFFSYYAPGYDSRDYIIQNGLIGNFVQSIPLYLATTATTDVVTLTITDQNYNPIPGALVTIQRWNVGTNTYPSVGMFTTSSSGQGIMNLELYNVWYRAIVTIDGQIVKVTDVQKLSSTTWNIMVEIGVDNPYELFGTISHGLTFDNSTNITTFTWVDSSGYTQQGCLVVQNSTSLGYETLYNSCLNSVAGIINYQLPGDGDYLIYGLVYLTPTYNVSQIVDTLTIRLGTPAITQTVSPYGKVLSMIAIGTMAMIGVAAGSVIFGAVLVIIALVLCVQMGWLNMVPAVIESLVLIIILILFRLSRRGA